MATHPRDGGPGFSNAPTAPLSRAAIAEGLARSSVEAARPPWWRDPDVLGNTALAAGTAAAVLVVPDLQGAWLEPASLAVLGTVVTFGAISGTRARLGAGSRLERLLLASFLFCMPTVYLLTDLRAEVETSWLLVELVGQVAFGALALLGVWRSPWFLAGGIVAHGLLWDSWQLNHGPAMPQWYAFACMVLDVAWGIYAITQVRSFARHKPLRAARA